MFGDSLGRVKRVLVVMLSSIIVLALSPFSARAINVTTYHYDNFRTGWNPNETVLTPSSVANGNFGVLAVATLSANIGAQPLIVQNVTISGQQAPHDIVYLVTNQNDVAAYDATTGKRYVQVNLGAPPPRGTFPLTVVVGILSTPVIDISRNAIYVVSCTFENNVPVYRLHELSLTSLIDIVPSVVIAGTHKVADGSTIQFNAAVQRQRPALLEANGNIYVAFGSFNDLDGTTTRGWLLGWNAGTLAPLVANEVTNISVSTTGNCGKNTPAGPCYLTSIWMSGFGPAADEDNNIFFVTANSQTNTYNPPSAIQESAVKVSNNLKTLKDIFTPYQVNTWDNDDLDFGSGGLTILPEQPGDVRFLAVTAGKSGGMYLLDRHNMGGYVPNGPDNVVDIVNIGACYCGESYFTGSDGVGRVVSSGGVNEIIWKLKTSPPVALVQESKSAALDTGQDRGFFTVVSSNGTQSQTGIVWAVARPNTTQGDLTLYALNAADSTTIFSSVAGTWPNVLENANVTPVVANGKVYVWGGTRLVIMGLGASRTSVAPSSPSLIDQRAPGHEIFGTVTTVNGTMIGLQTRKGTTVMVDNSGAFAHHRSSQVFVGQKLMVDGDYDKDGVLHATLTLRAKSSPLLWYSDK